MTPAPSSAPISDLTDETSDDEIVLCWTLHLARKRPEKRVGLALCTVAVAVVGLLLFQNLWFALVFALALVFSVSEYVFPATYTLTRQKAALKCGLLMLEMRWADVRHAYLADDGVKLSPMRVKNARMEPLRGIFLRFGDDNKDAVIDAVRRLKTHHA